MSGSGEIEISFKKARGGPSVYDPASQLELKAITASLHAAGVAFSYPKREMAFDSAEELLEIVVAANITFRALRPIIVEWIKGRAGQKVRITAGDKSVEAATIDEAERAWHLIAGNDQEAK
jgi:hypothetical protein